MHYRHRRPDIRHHWGKSASVMCWGCSRLCSLMSMDSKYQELALVLAREKELELDLELELVSVLTVWELGLYHQPRPGMRRCKPHQQSLRCHHC